MIQPEIVFAPARRRDATAIAAMSRDLIEHGLEWSWGPQRVLASMQRRDTLVVTARVDQAVVGFGIMRYAHDDAHLDLLGVAPAYRRMGLGRRLLEWLELPALTAGIRLVQLEVRERNHGAQAFYARLGYRSLVRVTGYYQGREAAVRMGRELGNWDGPPVEIVWPSPTS